MDLEIGDAPKNDRAEHCCCCVAACCCCCLLLLLPLSPQPAYRCAVYSLYSELNFIIAGSSPPHHCLCCRHTRYRPGAPNFVRYDADRSLHLISAFSKYMRPEYSSSMAYHVTTYQVPAYWLTWYRLQGISLYRVGDQPDYLRKAAEVWANVHFDAISSYLCVHRAAVVLVYWYTGTLYSDVCRCRV